MSIFLRLSTLALRGVIGGAAEASGLGLGETSFDRVVGFLTDRFRDQSRRLEQALRQCNTRAWNALEIALAGDTFWRRLTATFTAVEDRRFAEQVKHFLNATPLPELADRGHFRDRILTELRQARKRFAEGRFDHVELARQTGHFARFRDTAAALDAEWAACLALADEVRKLDLDSLAWLLAQRPESGPPLLVLAVRYFFRRAVEEDDELFRGLAFAKLEAIADAQQMHLVALAEAFTARGDRLEELLGGLGAAVADTHANVLDLREMMHGQTAQIRQLGDEMTRALARLEMDGGEPQPRHSFALRDDRERRLVRALMERYRSLPEDEKERLPALLHALGKLGFAAGDFREAVTDFQHVAEMVADPGAKAEAHYSAYRAALEEGLHDVALAEFVAAVRLDGRRWSPFPADKYVPERILGAGGFGVAFKCRHRFFDEAVVVKALEADGIEVGARQVFSEAQLLRQLDHPSIVRISDCGYVEGETPRPFLVMDYFDGPNLHDHVQRHGPLSVGDLVAVARVAAEGLGAAHARGILHRDVKPANLLVRRDPGGWRVKLIDFGLALKQEMLDASTTRRGAAKTVLGRTVEGTLEYAAPEQLGKLPGVTASPASDVYAFGRTCCYALFGTPQPLPRHFRNVPDWLVSLLEDCLEERPAGRPKSFDAVLGRLRGPEASPPPPPADEWFYFRNGAQSGPVPLSVLRELLITRQLSPGELVWKAGMERWVAASAVPGLVPDLPPPVPMRATVAEAVVGEPSWLASTAQFCEQTHRFWLSGKASGFAPSYQQIARDQPRAEFLREIRSLSRFVEEQGYPFYQDEALVGSGQTMVLTTYRLLITTPQRRVLCLPLADLDGYAFEGAQGTWLGFFVGSDLKLSGTFGRYHWEGEQLSDLYFPTNEYVHGVQALAEWRRLPKAALRALDRKRDEVFRG